MEQTVTTEAGASTASSRLVELLLSPFDELAEVDLNSDTLRGLHHTEKKYYIPAFDGGFREMFRYCAEYMVHPDDRERYLREMHPDELARRFASGEGVIRGRFRYKLLNGEWHWVEQVDVGGAEYGMPPGVYYSFLYDVQDETDGAQAQSHASGAPSIERDTLTGLLWSDQFFVLAPGFIKERTEGWCMLAIDLEHFKLFNEWYGRDEGDRLLSQVGTLLLRMTQELHGLDCYLGQDDFALLIPYDMERIEALYDQIHACIKERGTSVGFMPAFGVEMVTADKDTTAFEYYDRAALAARRAKDNYHERIRRFDPGMYEQTDRDYRILSDFQKGLREHELFIQLQPQCLISNGRIVGAESLVRWRKSNGEMVSPGVFVPVLEKYGFVTDLDKYVWEEVCIWQKRWIDSGHTPLPISVNVSQIDIFTIDVPAFFVELVKKYDLPVSAVKIEITESAYVDNEVVSETVQQLRNEGFVVLMDDFGSGYSSLNMLRNLNVDIIKLDAQFLRMSGDDRKGVQIMESIVTMAKTMGVPIIVEGVETKEETEFLSGLGCRYVQGYYFYRPMPVEDFENLIGDAAHVDTHGFRFKAKEQFHIREFLDQNLFSDTVLNNILGPVAFYEWKGDDVNIVRCNQQFRDETRSPNLAGRMKSIQQYAVREDVQTLYTLLERAMHDPINGAGGVLRFYRADGSISQLRVRFFHLKKDGESRIFYGSVHDLTEFIMLNDQLRLLSQISRDTIVFVRRRGALLTYHAVVHGLMKEMCLTAEQLQRELATGRFFERFDEQERSEFADAALHKQSNRKSYTFTVRMTGHNSMTLPMLVRYDYVDNEECGVAYIITFRCNS